MPSGHQGAGCRLNERRAVTLPVLRTSPWVQVKSSKIHGKGVFAAKRIPRGTRVIEYLGERISHAEADARYEHLDPADNHTFLFIVDKKIVIDAGVGGNAARYINHSCDGNCESVIEERRVFIEATRTIEAGEELAGAYHPEGLVFDNLGGQVRERGFLGATQQGGAVQVNVCVRDAID